MQTSLTDQIIAEALANYKEGRKVEASQTKDFQTFWNNPNKFEMQGSMEAEARILQVYEELMNRVYYNIYVASFPSMCARINATVDLLTSLAMSPSATASECKRIHGEEHGLEKYCHVRWVAENEALMAVTSMIELQIHQVEEERAKIENGAENKGQIEDILGVSHEFETENGLLVDVDIFLSELAEKVVARQVVLMNGQTPYTNEEIARFDLTRLPQPLEGIKHRASADIHDSHRSNNIELLI